MKKILLWNLRYPERAPQRLTVDDAIASVAVRAGVAVPVDPADTAALLAGGPVDGSTPTDAVIGHGLAGDHVSRVVVPLAVLKAAQAAGKAAPVEGAAAAATVAPTPTPTPPTPQLTATPSAPSINAGAAPGSLVFAIGGVPTGSTPTVTPNDGRFVIAGDAASGWRVVTGMSALSAGQVAVSVAAAGAAGVTAGVTVTAAGAGSLTLSPTTATAGTAATLNIGGTSSGSSLASVAIPAGMMLNSSARTITGTPTTAGPFDVVLDETAGGVTTRTTISINIAPASAPALGAVPSAPTISTAAPVGSSVFNITGVPAGQTPTINPADARFGIGGDATNGWRCVVASAALSAGSASVTATAPGATPITVPVTIAQAGITPASSTIPLPVEGVIGGDSLYPQASVLRGSNADKFAVGGGLANGNQVVRIYDHATSALLETRTVRAIDGKDDHKGVCVAAYSNGGFTAFATGHNNQTDFRVFFSDRAPDGTWTETTITYPQRVTYPTGILDKNERMMFFIRANNNTWTVRMRNGFAGAFGDPVTFATHPNQLYFQSPRYDPVTHRVYCSIRPNDDDAAEAGRIKLLEFDCATGEWFDANGGLGKIDGTASANGKKLPFAYYDVAIQFDKAANAAYRVEDRSYDGRSMIVRTSIDAAQSPTGLDRNEVRVWRCPTGDRMIPANWSQGPLIYNMEKTTAGGPKCRFDVAPRAANAYRFYGEKGIPNGGDVNWQINRYDSTDNGATWTETLMEQSPMVIIHTCPLENAVATTPVAYLQYAAYVSFDDYTQTATRFFKPYAARGAPLLFDTFTDVSPDVDLSAHTPQVGGAWTRKAAVSSANPIMVSNTQSRLYAPTAVAAQYNNGTPIPASAKKVRATTKISVQGAADNTIATAIYADPTAYTSYSSSVRKSTGAWGVNRIINGTQQTVMSGTIPGSAVKNGDCLELEVETIDANTRRLTFIYNGVAYGTPYTDTNASALTGATTDVRYATTTTTSGGGIAHDSLMVQVVE